METATLVPTIVLTVLQGNAPVELGLLQALMEPHTHLLTLVWLSIWCTTAVFVLLHLYKEWRKRR